MVERYLVLSAGYGKETGEPYARLGAITEGISKMGKAYQFAETDKTKNIDRFVPVGTIITYAMTEVTPDGEVVEAPSATGKPGK